ncbi:MAG: hypothetical protein JOZ71_02990 [Ktedonobacteraceae bacterium]|nr:hypothetical protein [Ktedonobacteraceae bacterium]
MYEVVEQQVLQELYSRWLLKIFAVHQYLSNYEAMMLPPRRFVQDDASAEDKTRRRK